MRKEEQDKLAKNLQKRTDERKGNRSSERINWSTKENEYLIKLCRQKNATNAVISDKMTKKFPGVRSYTLHSVSGGKSTLGIAKRSFNSGKKLPKEWTESEKEMLKSLCNKKKKIADIVNEMNQNPPEGSKRTYTEKSIKNQKSRLGLTESQQKGAKIPWEKEELDEFLKLRENDKNAKEIAQELHSTFGNKYRKYSEGLIYYLIREKEGDQVSDISAHEIKTNTNKMLLMQKKTIISIVMIRQSVKKVH